MNLKASRPSKLKAAPAWRRLAQRAAWFALFLALGVAIFALGVDYHTRLWTNTSGAYKIGLSALLLAVTLGLYRTERARPYGPVAMALFAASLTNVVTWYLAAPLQRWLLGLIGIAGQSPQGLALGKGVDAVLRLVPIFGVVGLAGDDLGSLFIRKGALRWSLSIGLLGLANLTATSLAVAASRSSDLSATFAAMPWWAAYALMNGFMEEIWYRGLFLGRLQPLVGSAGALWATSLVFGISHLFAAYIEPSGAPVFGIIVLTLGLTFGLLMQKTKTLWGSTIFHMAADLYWFVAFGF